MLEKKIVVCIGTDRSKNVRARLSLLLVEDGNVISEKYHSMALSPGDDLAQLRAATEKHIATPNGGVPGAPWPAIPDDEWANVEAMCAAMWTPEVIAARKAATAKVQSMESDAQAAAPEQS